MRIGLLGAGYMGRLHASALASLPGVDVVAVAGATAGSANAQALACDLGVGRPVTLEEVLGDGQIQAVVVTTPTLTHKHVVGAALAAGKHVLCETPLAKNSADATDLAMQAQEAGRHLQVGLLARFADPGVWAREQLDAGVVGEVRTVRVARLAPGTAGAHHGDAIEEILLFELDWLRWTFGEPLAVAADAVPGPHGRIDHVVARLRFEGALAIAEASYLLPRGRPLVVEARILGDQGELAGTVELPAEGPPSVRLATYVAGSPPHLRTALGAHPVEAEDAHIVGVFRGEKDPRFLGAPEAAASLRLAERVRDATRHP